MSIHSYGDIPGNIIPYLEEQALRTACRKIQNHKTKRPLELSQNSNIMISPSILAQRDVKEKDTPLHQKFQPGPYDVICSRGKVAYNHSGNIHFRSFIEGHLEGYRKCLTKVDKSLAVITIVEKIRNLSPDGGFVKFCKTKNSYVEVGDQKAREKVGHYIRDLINSSGKAKKGKSTWKNCAKKTAVKTCVEPTLALKTDNHVESCSVTDMLAGAYTFARRASSVVLSTDHIKDLVLGDDFLMDAYGFKVGMDDDLDEPFAHIFDKCSNLAPA